ncbi:MAG: glycerol kinase GlpK [Cyanobacteriota bacterium]|nr:glycerol kinase GlpK [Cyanobacteriota bacterium]
MTEPLLLALDQGTSSSRAALFNGAGETIAVAQVPLSVHYPADGWVEQDAEEIWLTQLEAMRRLEASISPAQRAAVAACGVTNQRETTILWRRGDSAALGPALVWQDRRTHRICGEWRGLSVATTWMERTGLVLDPYFSASKIRWLLDQDADACAAQQQGELCFGTVDSWLLWQLSGGRRHATDFSNASRTLLLDLDGLDWLPLALEQVGIGRDSLPELLPCRASFATITAGLPFAGTPITALMGDQQAATFGQFCLKPGQAKCTYGTGAFLVVNSGREPLRAPGGLLSTVGWVEPDGQVTYCLEGSVFNAGTVVQWLRDGLGLIRSAEEMDGLAASVASAGDVMLVPAFTGWGCPHWDPSARGLLIGLNRDSGAAHIARAALDGVALSISTLVELAETALGVPLDHLAVDGGAAASDLLLQAQADSSGLEVKRPAQLESTALGVALMAGLEAGVIHDLSAAQDRRGAGISRFVPQLDPPARQCWRRRWDDAVQRSLHWHSDDSV